MAMSVDLGAKLEAYVSDLASKGRYGSKSEVLREGVRLVQEREARYSALREAVDQGLAQADAGQTLDMDEVFDRLEVKYGALAED